MCASDKLPLAEAEDSANFKLQTYVVVDGTYVPKKYQGPWYNAHVCLMSVVTPPSQDTVSDLLVYHGFSSLLGQAT